MAKGSNDASNSNDTTSVTSLVEDNYSMVYMSSMIGNDASWKRILLNSWQLSGTSIASGCHVDS